MFHRPQAITACMAPMPRPRPAWRVRDDRPRPGIEPSIAALRPEINSFDLRVWRAFGQHVQRGDGSHSSSRNGWLHRWHDVGSRWRRMGWRPEPTTTISGRLIAEHAGHMDAPRLTLVNLPPGSLWMILEPPPRSGLAYGLGIVDSSAPAPSPAKDQGTRCLTGCQARRPPRAAAAALPEREIKIEDVERTPVRPLRLDNRRGMMT
jgi:hypothetical protein